MKSIIKKPSQTGEEISLFFLWSNKHSPFTSFTQHRADGGQAASWSRGRLFRSGSLASASCSLVLCVLIPGSGAPSDMKPHILLLPGALVLSPCPRVQIQCTDISLAVVGKTVSIVSCRADRLRIPSLCGKAQLIPRHLEGINAWASSVLQKSVFF